MSLELWNTFGTFGTFVVIGATAIAALVQLRHARGSNQIAALTQLMEASATPQFSESERLIRTELASKLKDPEFRYQIANPAARTSENQGLIQKATDVGNFYENIGLLVRTGLVDRDLAVIALSSQATGAWRMLAPVCAIVRPVQGEDVWENLEFFVVLSQDWIAAHPHGAYPAGVRRIVFKNEWLETDRQYAASRASA